MCQRRVSFSLHRHVSRLVLQGIVIHALRADCARLDSSIRLARAPDILSNLIKLPRVSGFPWFLGEEEEASMKVGVVKFAKLRELDLRFSRRTSRAEVLVARVRPCHSMRGSVRFSRRRREGAWLDSIIHWLMMMEWDNFREGNFFFNKNCMNGICVSRNENGFNLGPSLESYN